MSFRHDQRGQAIQVGAVLLFAILIVAFSTYQAVIVPADNERVEFNHNQEVQDHLAELRNAVLGSAEATSTRSVRLPLGTTYPSRTLGLNPNAPSGSLRTVGTTDPMVNLTIDNANASGETGDFWDGSVRTYDTGAIQYSPNYHRYDEAPTTVYEHSVLYNRFPSSNALALANQTLLDDDRLSIVTVNGSLDRTSSRSTSVDVRPMSSSGTRVAVTSADSPITLNFSSRLSREHWNASIPNQHTVSEGEFPSPEDYHSITVELAEREQGYRLGMAKAAVGQGATGEDEAYLTTREPMVGPVPRGTNRTLTLTVRDRYNNPVSGVEVDAAIGEGDGGTLDATMNHSDADGTVSFEYRASDSTSSGRSTVNFTIDDEGVPDSSFNRSTPENVSIEVDVGEGGAYSVDWTDPSGEDENDGAGLSCEDGFCTWDLANSDDDTILLNATLNPPFEGIDLEFAVDDASVGTLSTTSGESGSDGAATTELTAEENGVVDVLASANDGSDTIEIEITGVSADPGPPGNLAYDDENQNGQYDADDGETTYTRSELESGLNDDTVNLVVPSDVGTISSSSITLSTNSITSAVDIEATNGGMDLTASDTIDLGGQSVSVTNGALTTIVGGDLLLEGSTLDVSTGEVDIEAGTVFAANADITAGNNPVTITSNAELDATGGSITSTTADVDLVSDGDMHLDSTAISATNGDAAADLNGGNYVLYVQEATIDDSDDTLEYDPNGVDIVGEPASGSVN